MRDALREHLAPLVRDGLITDWHDRKIVAGDAWEAEIDEQISAADIVLVLLSPSYLASEFCWTIELPKALERLDRREVRIIPIVLRPCLWQNTALARLQALPTNARPVTDWADRDMAFVDIVRAVRLAAEDISKKRFDKHRQDARQKLPGFADTPQQLLADITTLADFQVFREIDSFWCPQLVVMPIGDFVMGSAADDVWAWPDERPQHRVTMSQRFAIGLFPITFAEYDEYCDAENRPKPDDAGWGRDRRPVINVNWHDARAYAAWLSEQTKSVYRLPTEADWEYACRASTSSAYAFGETLGDGDANYANRIGGTTEVGSYPANPWGLYDMHGNVWEWVEDSLGALPPDTAYPVAPATSQSANCRIVRGGCWNSLARQVRSAARLTCPSELRSKYVGFRVVRTL
jgi:hypothetical protein